MSEEQRYNGRGYKHGRNSRQRRSVTVDCSGWIQNTHLHLQLCILEGVVARGWLLPAFHGRTSACCSTWWHRKLLARWRGSRDLLIRNSELAASYKNVKVVI